MPLGSTGEAAVLDEAERDQVLGAALEEAQGRPVVAGTGSQATAQAIAWTRRARELGAQAALVVTPFYNRPTQGGLVAHYRAIAGAVPGFPLVAYNVPSRTGVNLEPATLAELWRIPEVVGLKESSGNLAPLVEALFLESNPIPLKALLQSLGLCGDRVRLPLLPASPSTREALAAARERARVA